MLNCSLNGSLPVPRLQWYINKTPASPALLTVKNNSDTTTDTVLSLALNLQQDHFTVSLLLTHLQTVPIKGKPRKQNGSTTF